MFTFFMLGCCAAATAQTKTEVLLVGTAHEFRDEYRSRQDFRGIINAVAGFNPQSICIESIPTWDTASLKAVRSVQMQRAERLRRRKDASLESDIAKRFYAQHDFWNAYYHWFMMGRSLENDAAKFNEFKSDTLAYQSYLRQQRTEFGNVIFPLADSLKISQFENIDDRADDARFQALSKYAMKRLILNLKLFKALRVYRRMKRDSEKAEEQGRLFEKVNEHEFQQRLVKVIDEFPTKWIKTRKAQELADTWTTRNKRMADRIVESIRRTHATRAAVFFGAAHIEYIRRELVKDPSLKVTLFSDIYSK